VSTEESRTSRLLSDAAAVGSAAAGGFASRLTRLLGGEERTRVILLLAAVLGLSGADVATVGASASELRSGLHITNTDIGLLVSVSSLVGAVATLPFGVLADRVRRTRILGGTIMLWGVAMLWSATASNFTELLWTRLFLGAVTASAGPMVASLVGDWFGSWERGRIYGVILAGEYVGAGVGSFVVLALPAFALALAVWRLREPKRGGLGVLAHESRPAPPEAALAEEGQQQVTDAQRIAQEQHLTPDPELVVEPREARRMGLMRATEYVLRVRTNVVLILASACGYYFLAGLQTFGLEFSKEQYGIDQALASTLLLVVGAGALAGVLAGGSIGDWLLKRGVLSARILTPAWAAVATTILFIPAIFTRQAVTAVPYLVAAAFFLASQNPPLDAARLDIMPPLLWGRAEAVRTLLRSLAVALAPLLFGAVSDYVFGGGRSGLQWTFVVMILPLGASAWLLFRARGTYPRDVATAAASAGAVSGYPQPEVSG
jgi:predicted MFS family arabinose efflux permease